MGFFCIKALHVIRPTISQICTSPWILSAFQLIMRSFLILSLIAIAKGRPDVSHLGYNYYAGAGHRLAETGSSSNVNGAILPAPNQNVFSHTVQPSTTLNQLPNVSPSVHRGSLQEPLVSKQFFVHSAPEDTEVQHKHFILGRPQKNYRVVFIKAPASTNSNVKISAEYAPTEEKTHIFVLSKKEPELDVNDIVTPAPTEPSKPEVFFVKYRTPEEAIHAQQRIQDQYDLVGGTSQVSDEGIAPVSSVIGALDNNVELAPSSSNQDSVRLAGGRQYLPPTTSYLPPRRH